jgi:hypothetical protein
MFHREDVNRLLRADTFLPIRILMTTGEAILVEYPEKIMPTLGWIELSDQSTETITLLNFAQIIKIEQLSPAS